MISEIREINSCNSWIENVLERIGGLEEAWLIGDFAKGKDSPVIDLALVGDGINVEALIGYIQKAEELSGRRIRHFIMKTNERALVESQFPQRLLIWSSNSTRLKASDVL